MTLDVSASINSLTLSGGSLGGAGTLTLYTSSHPQNAAITVSNGPQTIGAPVIFASDALLNIDANSSLAFGSGISGSGNLTLIGGGLLTLNNTDTYGRAISVNDGSLSVNGTIAASTAIMVNGGSVSIDDLTDLPGMLTFVSGTLNTNSDLHVGAGHALAPTSINSADQVTIGGALTLDSGITQLIGGSLSVSRLANTAGSLNFTSGTLNIQNQIGGSLNLTTTGPLGASLNVQPSMTLNVADTITVAADGAMSISGGTVTTGKLINNSASPVVFSSGNLTVDSLTLDPYGPGRPLGNTLSVPVGSNVAINGALNVGQSGSASIDAHGSVTAGDANLAAGPGSTATAFVTGYMGTSGHLTLGGTWDPVTETNTPGGSATMTISGGGTVSVAGATRLYAGSSITLDGGTLFTGTIEDEGGTISFASNPSTELTDQGDLAIGTGHALHAPVDIVSGSTLNAYGNVTFDPGADVMLDGGTANFGSVISNGGHLHVISGLLGIGNLELDAGSAVGPTLNVQNLSVVVAGATTLSPGASLTIAPGGSFSTGSLINNTTNPITFAGASLAINDGLTIDTFGPNRPLGNSVALHGNSLAVGLLQVGETNSGTLVVDSGGTLSSGDAGIGSDPGSVGSVHIGGTAATESDASWTAGQIFLGYEPLDNDGPLVDGGVGSLHIGLGATVNSNNVFIRRGSSMTIEGGTVSASTISLAGDSDPAVGAAIFTMTGGSFGTLGISVDHGCTCSFTGTASSQINVLINSGTTIMGGTQNWSAPGSFVNLDGTSTFQTDSGSVSPTMLLFADGGSVILSCSQHMGELALSGSAQVSMPAASPRNLLVTGQLQFAGSTGAWSGLLDLANNDMIVHGGVLADLTDQIAQGFNGGLWNGANGIISSSAAATNNTALAIELNDDGTDNHNPLMTMFDGEPVSSTDVLIKYTYFGDTNLDGVVNAADYIAIDNGFTNKLTGWSNGDVNYDGKINGDDYTLADNAFNTQGSVSFASISAGPAEMIAVPEPASLSLLGILAGQSLFGRRRLKRAGARASVSLSGLPRNPLPLH